MRIVKTDADRILHFPAYVQMTPELESSIVYLESDTIEITDEGWVQIMMDFADSEYYLNEFPKYLKELIKIAEKEKKCG